MLASPTPTVTPMSAALPALAPMVTAYAASHLDELRRRDGAAESYSALNSCYDRADSSSCDVAYVSCIDVAESGWDTVAGTDLAAATTLYKQLESCYCTYGVPYLDCYFGALTASGCSSYFSSNYFSTYASEWFYDNCGTVPPTLKEGAAAATTTADDNVPSTVSLDFESVTTTTLKSTPPPPTYTYAPLFVSTASLLHGECASTRFNLLEDTSTVYWAAYAGCGTDKPQCCPWTAASVLEPLATATDVNNANNVFPVPARNTDATLRRCPADYTAVAGNCCPSSYWPFTRALGGQTPCYSSLTVTTEAPKLTVGLVGQPTHTQKPTSAVVNVVWAMSFPVTKKKTRSRGLVAGIVLAVLLGIAAISGIIGFVYRRRQKVRHGPAVVDMRTAVAGPLQRPWWRPKWSEKQQQQPQQQQQHQQPQQPYPPQQPPPAGYYGPGYTEANATPEMYAVPPPGPAGIHQTATL